MKEKGAKMKKAVRALSIINVSVSFLSQILLLCFAVLLLAFGKKLAAGDFTLPEIFSDIMFVFIMVFLFETLALIVMRIFRQIKYDKVYRHYYRFVDVFYFIMTAVLPIFFWQMWMTYDFRVRALIFALILQFSIALNAFFKDRYLKQYLKKPDKPSGEDGDGKKRKKAKKPEEETEKAEEPAEELPAEEKPAAEEKPQEEK